MLVSLKHRGPDDWGVWTGSVSGTGRGQLSPAELSSPWSFENLSDARWQAFSPSDVMLGHTRLSIVDLSQEGHQPLAAEGTAVMVFNGEIYNYIELREELRRAGYHFRSAGDAEVLLKSYLAWGAECLSRLNGFFAFAIWDMRRGELFAARDRLGKKPFYYFQTADGALLFASEIKTLWASGATSFAVDHGVAARYLALGGLPSADETFFEGLRQLPAASSLRWRVGQSAPEIARYWHPQASFDQHPPDAEEQLRALLADSVRLRYRADVPVGICLSGGVDSSSILSTSVETRHAIGQGELCAFTALHDDERLSEEANVRQVLQRYPQVKASYLPTTHLATYEEFLEFLRFHDEPLSEDGIFNQYRFMREVRKAKMKVMLSGQGSDELFLGYPWFIRPFVRCLIAQRRLGRAFGWLREWMRRANVGWLDALRGLASEARAESLIAHKRTGATRWLRAAAWQEHCARAYAEELKLARDWPAYHLSQIFTGSLTGLLKDEDRNSMGNSIETRLPYLDYRLVEWALTLSPSLNLRRGMTKYLVRSAFASRLPPDVSWSKRKQGFYVPFVNRWDEHSSHLREALRGAEWIRELIDVPAALKLLEAGQLDRRLTWRIFNLLLSSENACERQRASLASSFSLQSSHC